MRQRTLDGGVGVVCDRCRSMFTGAGAPAAAGWMRSRDGGDLCTHCAAHLREVARSKRVKRSRSRRTSLGRAL